MQSTKLTRYALNTVQAAAYLDMSPGHLYNLISTRRGPRHVKYGGYLRFDAADLDSWVASESQVVETSQPPSDGQTR